MSNGKTVRPRYAAFAFACLTVTVVVRPAAAIKIVAYNLLNYPGSSATQRDPLFRTIMTDLQPDIVIAEEVQGSGAQAAFKTNVLNVVNPGAWSDATHFFCGDTDQSLFYRIASVSTAGTGSD